MIIQLMDAIVDEAQKLCVVDSIPSQSIHVVSPLSTIDSKSTLEGIGWLNDQIIHVAQYLLEAE